MNLVTSYTTKSPLAQRLFVPTNSKQKVIRYIIYANVALYGSYVFSAGPFSTIYKRSLTLNESSSFVSPITCHFAHTSFTMLAFNTGVLMAIGNRHIVKYGARHFATIYGLGLLAGGLLATYDSLYNRKQRLAGGIAGSGALIGYHVLNNPSWFSFVMKPLPLLTLFALYGAFYKDRAALGGLGAGYLAFIMGF